ncbi:MAG: serine hydrolase [Candidatus Choladocola sp.]|nr:serine hydrolase [Candidatus Choladocola sp.]
MNNRKRKNRDFPVTAFLAVAVVVLIVCASFLGWSVLKMENSGNREKLSSQEQSKNREGSLEQEEQTEAAESSEAFPEGETSELVTEAVTESLTEESTAAETEKDTETESETETETESETEAEKLVVAIDPGHQGSWVDMSEKEPNGPGSTEMKAKATTGTEGRYSGKKEYELNLEVSLLLRDELEERGYRVILTREDHDTAISNAERAQLAYEEGGDIYVRIHANGSDDSGVRGALAMVPSPNNPYVGSLAEDSYLLADCILSSYCSKASFDSQGIQYYDNMTGINWSKLPVMILEMGYMTNESDDLRMADESVQKLMAEGIADGIDAYFVKKGMKEKEVSKEAESRMAALMETLGEDEVYPVMEQGENWAVSLKDLDTEAEGDINGDIQMKSASVIKVFIMAAIYDRVCYPSSEDRRITINESYDGELKQLITDMITVSDNTAANTLLERLGGGDAASGMQVVNQFCAENGYMNTAVGRKFLEENPSGDNYTSANDCRDLLERIYRGTCVCPEASAKMYEYLKQQTRTNKIPAGLSGTDAVSANKTGELAGEYGDYVENDIAIVESGDSAFILCVLSQDLQDNGSAISRISEIAGKVYNVCQ